MKRKLLLMLVMTFVFALVLTFAVSAEETSVHNENTVDYSATVTLDDGTVCNLFDSEGNALIWYLDSSSKLQSIRADDIEDGDNGKRVVYVLGTRDNVLVNINIYSGDSVVGRVNNILVFNIMDDDIAFDANTSEDGIQPFTILMETFNAQDKHRAGGMKLEYAYLRLDTTAIGGKAFSCCYNLKYINLEELTELELIGAMDGYNHGGTFFNCTSLFNNEKLDLSKTKLTGTTQGGMTGDGNFEKVPFTSVVFPETFTTLERWTFDSCPNLISVTLGSAVKVDANAFLNATALENIFYVGTLDELRTVINNAHSSGNDIFWNMVGTKDKGAITSGREMGNLVSYTEYLALDDESKSGKIVYDYSWCETYNDGIHLETTAINPCVGICNECSGTVVNHTEAEKLTVTIEYSNYSEAGVKTVACQNEGCTYKVTEEAKALFTCLGYSAPENGIGGIAVGYSVNDEAISEYTRISGKTINYGVFVALEKIGTEDAVNANGELINGALGMALSNYKNAAFEIKITGFKDTQKDEKFAVGAFVITTAGEEATISYMQVGTPSEGAKYEFVSYNSVVNG